MPTAWWVTAPGRPAAGLVPGDVATLGAAAALMKRIAPS